MRLRQPRALGFGLGIVLTLASSAAIAGYISTPIVEITPFPDGSAWFSGGLSAARNAPDSSQAIGCLQYFSPGSAPYVTCFAEDSGGTFKACVTSDPAFVGVTAALNPASSLEVNVDAQGNCKFISVENASWALH